MSKKTIWWNLEHFTFNNRKIYIWDDINEQVTADVVEQIDYFLNKSNEDITIMIHSHGGDVDCEVAIIDEILKARDSGVIVRTQVMGIAYSAAATILALGSPGYRSASQHSTIMLHPFSISLDKDYTGYQEKLMSFMRLRENSINKLVAKACKMHTKRKYEKFLQDIDKGLWLTAQQAIEYGVIDKIEKGIGNGKKICK